MFPISCPVFVDHLTREEVNLMRRNLSSSPHQPQYSERGVMPDISLVPGREETPVNMISRVRRGSHHLLERERIISRNMNGTSKYC